MKLTITEVRDIVAQTIRETLIEAKRKGKKPKELPPQSEDAVRANAERKVRGTGYRMSPQNDYSQPLGSASTVRQQGGSGIGNWTNGQPMDPPDYGEPGPTMEKVRMLVRMIVAEELNALRKG